MIRLSVLYPQTGAPFDWTYYLDIHMPLVSRKLGDALKAVTVEQGVSGGASGTQATYIALAHLTFDSVETFQASFSPHAEEIMGDIPNYTPIEPIVQISEIKMAE